MYILTDCCTTLGKMIWETNIKKNHFRKEKLVVISLISYFAQESQTSLGQIIQIFMRIFIK